MVQTVVDLTLYRPTNVLGTLIHDPGTENRGGTRPPRLVTASNRLCVWPIKRMSRDRSGHSHTAPVCGVVYSTAFQQIVSGGDDGSIQVWDIRTGAMEFKFNKTHGKWCFLKRIAGRAPTKQQFFAFGKRQKGKIQKGYNQG